MGYLTNYTIETPYDESEDGKNYLKSISGYDWYGDTLDDAKWYHYGQHLKGASKEFPEVTFILSGVGEDFPDMWKIYRKGELEFHTEAKVSYDQPNWLVK